MDEAVQAAALAAVFATVGLAAQEDALTTKARGIHERVMTLDTHNDISPNNFTAECNYTMDLGFRTFALPISATACFP